MPQWYKQSKIIQKFEEKKSQLTCTTPSLNMSSSMLFEQLVIKFRSLGEIVEAQQETINTQQHEINQLSSLND